jgi:cysteine desulfurase
MAAEPEALAPSPMAPIYLDYNATTPTSPEVADAMRPFLESGFGNPSSVHWAGGPPKSALDEARRHVGTLLNCQTDEIVFTSGGSEANNLALKGRYFVRPDRPAHVITSRIEHPATLAPCGFLERLGVAITYLPVDGTGLVNPDDVRKAIRNETILISIMHANNEVGTIQPIADIARIAREHGIPVHTDAAQSVGKISVRIDDLGVDLLSVAGHKLYAPKGIGALYVRRGTALEPLIHGAGQERGWRAGTESAFLALGLGVAFRTATTWVGMPSVQGLRDLLWQRLQSLVGKRVILNGHPVHRLPNTLNVSFAGYVGAEILARMPRIAASTGSACHSGQLTPSPVLAAMGVRPEIALGAIRFSLGRATTAEEIEQVARELAQIVR